MPVTPLYFGVGMIGKGLFARRLSLTSFIVSQVVIDLEVAYHMLVRHEWPFHRWVHTFVVGALIGVSVGAGVVVGGRMLRVVAGSRWQVPDLSEASWLPAIAGGLLGGLTHPVLDGVMHDDIAPLGPFSQANPSHNVIGGGTLHVGLAALTVVGVVLLRFVVRRLSSSQ